MPGLQRTPAARSSCSSGVRGRPRTTLNVPARDMDVTWRGPNQRGRRPFLCIRRRRQPRSLTATARHIRRIGLSEHDTTARSPASAHSRAARQRADHRRSRSADSELTLGAIGGNRAHRAIAGSFAGRSVRNRPRWASIGAFGKRDANTGGLVFGAALSLRSCGRPSLGHRARVASGWLRGFARRMAFGLKVGCREGQHRPRRGAARPACAA
jgi:hypothetical protein